jgi:hypothetical protein
MGQTAVLPPDRLGCAVPRHQLFLYLGRLSEARHIAGLAALYQDIGWEGDRARYRLIEAETARRRADPDGCFKHLVAAAGWILHSGSVEHLCQWHLIRARAARDVGDHAFARTAVEEGLHLARRCGLGLYHIELLCEEAELSLADGNGAAAERAARDAHKRASAADCQFRWGSAAAGHLLGQALAALGNDQDACHVLEDTLDLRRQLGDPKAGHTERLLHRVRRGDE